jgi:predicted O-methyltransferase YrrM
MNDILRTILKNQEVVTPSGKSLPLHSHIPQSDCEIIQAWICEQNCRHLIEIGLGYGISSLFICDALHEKADWQYHIFDPNQDSDWHGVGLYHLAAAGFDTRINFHAEASELGLPLLLQSGFTCDFALVDGRHTFDQSLVDFYYVNKMMAVGGIVIFDDIQLPAIQRVVRHIATYPGYKELTYPPDFSKSKIARVRKIAGIPLARVVGFKKVAPDEREHDWYEDF